MEKEGVLLLSARYRKALLGIEGFSHLWVISFLDGARHAKLRLRAPGGRFVGVFATRAASRPNPIGVSAVRLLKIQGARLWVDGLDLQKHTPILDLKPYTPRDCVRSVKIPPWVAQWDLLERDPLRRYSRSLKGI